MGGHVIETYGGERMRLMQSSVRPSPLVSYSHVEARWKQHLGRDKDSLRRAHWEGWIPLLGGRMTE